MVFTKYWNEELIGNMSVYKEAQNFNDRRANKSVLSPHASFMGSTHLWAYTL